MAKKNQKRKVNIIQLIANYKNLLNKHKKLTRILKVKKEK